MYQLSKFFPLLFALTFFAYQGFAQIGKGIGGSTLNVYEQQSALKKKTEAAILRVFANSLGEQLAQDGTDPIEQQLDMEQQVFVHRDHSGENPMDWKMASGN